MTIRLQEQIQHDEAKFEVQSFIDLRQEREEFQVLTKWLGIDEESWAPINVMVDDVPKLLKKFLGSRDSTPAAFQKQYSSLWS